jgi:hypothetical protein
MNATAESRSLRIADDRAIGPAGPPGSPQTSTRRIAHDLPACGNQGGAKWRPRAPQDLSTRYAKA